MGLRRREPSLLHRRLSLRAGWPAVAHPCRLTEVATAAHDAAMSALLSHALVMCIAVWAYRCSLGSAVSGLGG